MAQKRKDRRQQAVDDPKEELRLQEYIFLWTFLLMVLLLVSLYLQINPIVPAAAGVVLVVSTIALYVKYREFYAVRDRGQRTWCSVLSMYASLLLTLGCAYLFGFLFFTYMAYRTLSRSMVVGNKRVRVKR